MRIFLFSLALLPFAWAQNLSPAPENQQEEGDQDLQPSPLQIIPIEDTPADPEAPIAQALVQVNATIQGHSFTMPWQRKELERNYSLGIALENGQFLTTALAVRDAMFIELHSADGNSKVAADVVLIDHELNLALLQPRETDLPFLQELQPVELAEFVAPGDELELWQLELTGQFVKSEGTLLRGVVVEYPGLIRFPLLAGEVRILVQPRPNSQAAPFVRNGRLAGLLMGYSQRQQVARMLPIDFIRQFLQDAEDGTYAGRSKLAFDWGNTRGQALRQWLQLPEDITGGVYLNHLPASGKAKLLGFQEGDVLLSVNDTPINSSGYVEVEHWGQVNFSHFVLGMHEAGETVHFTLWRDGSQLELEVELPPHRATEELIPILLEPRGPNYLVLGGAVLQELTANYLKEFPQIGEDSMLRISQILNNPEEWQQEHERVVVWCYAIPTPATFGYEQISNAVIDTINGEPATDLATVQKIISETPANELIELGILGSPETIWLDPLVISQVNLALAEQGLLPLKKIQAYTEESTEEMALPVAAP